MVIGGGTPLPSNALLFPPTLVPLVPRGLPTSVHLIPLSDVRCRYTFYTDAARSVFHDRNNPYGFLRQSGSTSPQYDVNQGNVLRGERAVQRHHRNRPVRYWRAGGAV